MDPDFWAKFYGEIYRDNNILPGVGADLFPKVDSVGHGPANMDQLLNVFGLKKPGTSSGGELPLVENTAPGAQWLQDQISDSGLREVPFGEGGLGGVISGYIGRGAIIILGLIFVAVGLAMFKPGLVVAAGEGFGDGVKGALTDG
jgi:hypothetical protein